MKKTNHLFIGGPLDGQVKETYENDQIDVPSTDGQTLIFFRYNRMMLKLGYFKSTWVYVCDDMHVTQALGLLLSGYKATTHN